MQILLSFTISVRLNRLETGSSAKENLLVPLNQGVWVKDRMPRENKSLKENNAKESEASASLFFQNRNA
jgi:hypothetical protein